MMHSYIVIVVGNVYAPVNSAPPPPSLLPRAKVGDSEGIDRLLNKLVAQGGGVMTIIEPPPQHSGANIGDLTGSEQQ